MKRSILAGILASLLFCIPLWAQQTNAPDLAAQNAALEQKVGQKKVELDFFQQDLRQVREQRQRRGVHGGTACTRSSKR